MVNEFTFLLSEFSGMNDEWAETTRYKIKKSSDKRRNIDLKNHVIANF